MSIDKAAKRCNCTACEKDEHGICRKCNGHVARNNRRKERWANRNGSARRALNHNR